MKELLTGRVKSADSRKGVRVSLDFFDDVWVPSSLLRSEMMWEGDDSGAGHWYWNHLDDAGEATAKLTLKRGDSVVVRVAALVFREPVQPSSSAASKTHDKVVEPTAAGAKSTSASTTVSPSPAPAPFAASGAGAAGGAVGGAGGDSRFLTAGGETGDGAHVPPLRTPMMLGGAPAPAPTLMPTPSLRVLQVQSAASLGVSGMGSVMSTWPSGARAERFTASGIAATARRQLENLFGSDESSLTATGPRGFLKQGALADKLGSTEGSDALQHQRASMAEDFAFEATPSAPFTVYCSIAEDGLGAVGWWDEIVEVDDAVDGERRGTEAAAHSDGGGSGHVAEETKRAVPVADEVNKSAPRSKRSRA